MIIIPVMRVAERALYATGLFRLWFSTVQLVMLPDEGRRIVWIGAAVSFGLAGIVLRVIRRV